MDEYLDCLYQYFSNHLLLDARLDMTTAAGTRARTWRGPP